jgi:hypothetical protein
LDYNERNLVDSIMKTYLFLATVSLGLGCVTVGLARTGSAGAFQMDWLAHASFDMSCPKDQLRAEDLGDQAVGVRGCGKKATYLFREGRGGQDDQWIMSGSVTADDIAPSAASPAK